MPGDTSELTAAAGRSACGSRLLWKVCGSGPHSHQVPREGAFVFLEGLNLLREPRFDGLYHFLENLRASHGFANEERAPRLAFRWPKRSSTAHVRMGDSEAWSRGLPIQSGDFGLQPRGRLFDFGTLVPTDSYSHLSTHTGPENDVGVPCRATRISTA